MFTLLIILAFIALCLIYLLQFQLVRDYKPLDILLGTIHLKNLGMFGLDN